jgi:chromosome segregation ATPase
MSWVGLVNHPEDDGDPKNIWCVWKNLRYNEDKTLGIADCYIIDNEWGKTAFGVLENDGPVGLSSSGLGDFEPDGITVDPNTYELERPADWVLNPSYSVFGTIDDKKESVASPKDDTRIVEEGKQMKTFTLREKRELEASLKKIYEDIKVIPNLKERLSRAKEALTFYEGEDTGGVESYKKEFEDLVTEAEKEFESKLKSAEEADEIKKEAEETHQLAKEKAKEAEDLKKENEELKKENEKLKDQIKEIHTLKDESEGLLASMTEDAKRQIKWEKYEELRQYAIRAAKLYSEMKADRNFLQIKVQELERNSKAAHDAQMQEYQKTMVEKTRIEEARQRTSEAKALRDKQLAEAQEKAFLEGVNPEVMLYWQDLLRVDEALATKYRKEILSRKTETEAQIFALKVRHGKIQRERQDKLPEGFVDRDLSHPIPMKNYRDTMPDVPMILPKGWL